MSFGSATKAALGDFPGVYREITDIANNAALLWGQAHDLTLRYALKLKDVVTLTTPAGKKFHLPRFAAELSPYLQSRLANCTTGSPTVALDFEVSCFTGVFVALRLQWLLRLHCALQEVDGSILSLTRLLRGVRILCSSETGGFELPDDSGFSFKFDRVNGKLDLDVLLDDLIDVFRVRFGVGFDSFLSFVQSTSPGDFAIFASSSTLEPPRLVYCNEIKDLLDDILLCFLVSRSDVLLKYSLSDLKMFGLLPPDLVRVPLEKLALAEFSALGADARASSAAGDRPNPADAARRAVSAGGDGVVNQRMAENRKQVTVLFPELMQYLSARSYASRRMHIPGARMDAVVMVALLELKALTVESEILYEIVGRKESFPEYVRSRILRLRKDERVIKGRDVNLDSTKLSSKAFGKIKLRCENILNNIRASRGIDVQPFLRPAMAGPLGPTKRLDAVVEESAEFQTKFRRSFSEVASRKVRDVFVVPKARGSLVLDEYLGSLRFSSVFKRVGIL